jgi:phosphatidylglycerol:prolipoprotein diacylglycerol transferase
MHPKLFTLPEILGFGPITIHTYGVIMAIAFLVGLWVVGRQATRAGLDRTRMVDLGVYTLIAGLIGSKLMLVVVDWKHHAPAVLALFWAVLGLLVTAPVAVRLARRYGRRAWAAWGVLLALAFGLVLYRYDFGVSVRSELKSLATSAGVFYGGFALALIVASAYVRRMKLPTWATLDVLAPGVAIGQAIGRLGCLCAGCCYGRQCSLPWAVTFRDAWAARHLGTPIDVPLHPTQLYESLTMLVIFLILIWMAPHKRFHGQVAAFYAGAYAVGRFVIEFFRGDAARGWALGNWLSTSQAIAIVVFVLVLILLPYLWKRQRVTSTAS